MAELANSPDEPRTSPSRGLRAGPTRGVIIGAALFCALAVVPQVSPWSTVMLTVALCQGMAALGILVLLRAGQVSFGHGLYFAAGAYAVAFLASAGLALDVVLLIPAGMVISVLISLVVGVFVVRYRYIFFGMLNLAVSMVAYSLLEKLFSVTGGGDGKRVPRPTLAGAALERAEFEAWMFYLTLGIAVIAALCTARYLISPLGKALDAIKTNETRLEYLGVSSRQVLLIAYAFSAQLVGLGGSIFALVLGHVTPELAYWVRSGEFVFITVLGGAGGVAGPFLGALAYELVRGYAVSFAAEMWHAILGIVLLVIIFFAPQGLVGFLKGNRTGAFR